MDPQTNKELIKRQCSFYIKSVHHGLYVFLFFLCSMVGYGQEDAGRATFMDEVTLMMEKYYFKNPDSALYHLNGFLSKASDHSWKRELLFVLIHKTYVAEHHFMIDSLDYYLHQADSVVRESQNTAYEAELDTELVQEISYMRGMYYYYQGDFSNALESFKKTLFENETLVIADSLQAFNSLVNVSQLSIMDGDYQNALQYAVMAEQVLPARHSGYNSVRDYNYQLAFIEAVRAKILHHQNAVRKDVQAYESVIKALENALKRLEGKENTPGAHNLYLKIYMQLSDAYVEVSNYKSALINLEKGLKLSTQADSEQQMKLLFETAAVHLKMNNADAALQYIEEGQMLAESGVDGGNRFKARASYEKGNIFLHLKKWEAALAAYQNALTYLAGSQGATAGIYHTPKAGPGTLESEFLKGMLFKADGFYDWYANTKEQKYLLSSIESYEEAVRLIDQIRMNFQNAESKQFLASVMLSTFEKGLHAAFEAYEATSDPIYLEKAFYFSEKSRANQLMEAVRDMSSKLFSGIPNKLLDEESQLKGRIYYWQQSLLELEKESPLRKERHQQLLQGLEKYLGFIEGLEKKYPKYHQLKFQSATVNLSQVKAGMESKEALVEYFYGDNALYIFGISQDTSILKRVPRTKSLHHQLLFVLNELKRPQTVDSTYQRYLKASHGLYQALIEPVKEVLPASGGRVLFITDGLLGYLPFETLVESEDIVKGENKSVLLLERYVVGYDYSVLLVKEKQKMTRDNSNNYYLGFAPGYDGGLLVNSERLSLSKLKFNSQEVAQAHEYLGGKIFLNQSATERNFRKNAAEAGILHMSMHARVDDVNPNSSAFYFEDSGLSFGEGDHKNDNVLHLYELYNMPLQADLVVLSACETGIGRYARGEGIMSLGRAFQFAGCPSVAMSLWPVNDRSSAAIMKDFFHNLSKGMEKDEALRQAKLSFINDPQNKYFAHPYYWSAFTLMGDPAPVVEKRYPTYTFLIITLLALVLIATVAFRRYRRA